MNGANTANATKTVKTLSLVKGKDQFCFRYEVGQEAKVLDALIDMVVRTANGRFTAEMLGERNIECLAIKMSQDQRASGG